MTDQQDKDVLGLSVREFAASLAAKTPTPGGGSAAGVVGALATALGEMALNFTSGKAKFAQHQEFYDHLSGRWQRAREMFGQLVGDDIAAYTMYKSASKLEESPHKAQAVQLALAAAVDVPRELAKLTLAVMEDQLALIDKCNPYLATDLAAGAALGAAVLRLCDYNVRVNVPQLEDRQAAVDIEAASRADLERGLELLQDVERHLRTLLP